MKRYYPISSSALSFLLLFAFASSLQAQLVTSPLGSMNLPSKSPAKSKSQRSGEDTLSLPFLEDFSYRGPSPDAALWLDEAVFVNTTYPVHPPSVGVATFDGLRHNGEPYSLYNEHGSADTLTSKPFHLDYTPADSIYLSFYYQPKGIGNYPEFIDSLLLEFKNPDDTVWTWVWGTKGEDYPQTAKEFLQVMVPLRDTAFLKEGFQFRFRNYAQLNGSWDHWHLDYIRMNTNRNFIDTTYTDYSFMYQGTSLLKEYQSVPLWHFLPNAIENMDTTFHLSLTSVSPTSSFRIYRYNFNNQSFPEVIRDSLVNFKGPIQPRQEYLLTEAVKYTYEDPGTEWTEFQLRHFLSDSSGEDLFHRNDTIEYLQVLSNYYALDDGSAEERLNINSNGGGFVAQRFESYVSDTIKAVQFYFNKTNETGSGAAMSIMIWAAGANQPGELLYSQSEIYPSNEGLNRYVTYVLNEPIFIQAGSFYIGWAQTSNFPINIGFDRNFNNNDRIYYDLTGTWYNYAAQEGTLMMRPVFRYPYDIYVHTPVVSKDEHPFRLYPNPANDKVTIERNNSIRAQLEMVDITGRLIQTITLNDRINEFSTTLAPAGVYIIRLIEPKKKVQFSKLIISH